MATNKSIHLHPPILHATTPSHLSRSSASLRGVQISAWCRRCGCMQGDVKGAGGTNPADGARGRNI
ncbi:hypothetical protein C8Q73DRAFT_718491 [Cubamyces lactineus]|nr:hypothetical protein C8Q73DRAFT_718491 [Cubamyces lactineus]